MVEGSSPSIPAIKVEVMEEIKGTLVVEDRTKIKAVHFKYPELMNESAREEIKNEYYNLLETEDKLFEAREKVRIGK